MNSTELVDRGCTYHIIDSDPESKKTIRAVPVGPLRLWRQKLIELPDLVDYGTLIFENGDERDSEEWTEIDFTHSTVGSKGATRAASIVAPPDAKLKTLNPRNRVRCQRAENISKCSNLRIRDVVCSPCGLFVVVMQKYDLLKPFTHQGIGPN